MSPARRKKKDEAAEPEAKAVEETPETEEETAGPDAAQDEDASADAGDDAAADAAEGEDGDDDSAAAGDDVSADAADDSEQAPAKGRRRGAAETATRARSRRPKADAEPVSVRAQARYVRTAPRKARLVVHHIRGKSVEEARAILSHTPRAAAEPILKVLESAVANAEHNHELLPEELRVEQVFVDEGPTLKRFRPRAQGRATRIRKRTSHITIRVTNR